MSKLTLRKIRSNHSLFNITRRDHTFHGWEYNKVINNTKTTVLFRDDEYGNNPGKSLTAAIAFRNNHLKKSFHKIEHYMGVPHAKKTFGRVMPIGKR
jgi:hypothetical protein